MCGCLSCASALSPLVHRSEVPGRMVYPSLGPAMRYYRRRRGMSQADLALDAELSQRSVSCYECGYVRPRNTTLALIAHALGVSISDLLDYGA